MNKKYELSKFKGITKIKPLTKKERKELFKEFEKKDTSNIFNEMGFTNKVDKQKYEYEEDVREFTGLIFHCPNCDEVFHLHIATVRLKK